MKKTLELISVGIILISLFSSCSVEKRRYMPGYNIQWNNSKPVVKRNEFVQKNKPVENDKTVPVEQTTTVDIKFDETVTASAVNSIITTYHKKEKSKHNSNVFPEECDVIILGNGDEIKAKVTEISQAEIKYRKCEELNGQTYTLRRSEVFMIKYPNGTKDIISRDVPAENKNKPEEKKDTGVFGILAFVCAVTFYLAPLAVVFGAIGAGSRRKLKGLAIAGLVLGIVAILIVIILALTFGG